MKDVGKKACKHNHSGSHQADIKNKPGCPLSKAPKPIQVSGDDNEPGDEDDLCPVCAHHWDYHTWETCGEPIKGGGICETQASHCSKCTIKTCEHCVSDHGWGRDDDGDNASDDDD